MQSFSHSLPTVLMDIVDLFVTVPLRMHIARYKPRSWQRYENCSCLMLDYVLASQTLLHRCVTRYSGASLVSLPPASFRGLQTVDSHTACMASSYNIVC